MLVLYQLFLCAEILSKKPEFIRFQNLRHVSKVSGKSLACQGPRSALP